jgi:dUTP pyrophosphatase
MTTEPSRDDGGAQRREPIQPAFEGRKRTAVHEASHVVAAKAYGLSIDFAEICADNSGGRTGQVVYTSLEFWGDSYAWANAVTALAGPQGELAFYKHEWGSTHDFERAKQSAQEVDPDYSDDVMRVAHMAAAKIVGDNRTVISALAAVLEREGKLSGEEIDGVIDSIGGKIGPGPGIPDMTPTARARRDAARRRARRDHESAAFIERWIRQQECRAMGETQEIQIMRLPHAADLPLPAYQSAGAAGLDLVAAVPADMPVIIAPGGRRAIPTGLAFALPPGLEGQIRPRSGLALHHGLTVLNSPGTLDSDYRGEVHVIVANFGDTSFAVTRGQRIAQLVLVPVVRAAIQEVTRLDEPTRGIRGFGSTGAAVAGGVL